MKAGARALGVAESYTGDRSTLAGAVVRADRTVDGFAFGSCTVGGTDATAAVVDLFDRLDREDVSYLLVAGIAPAWYNVLNVRAIADAVDRPVLSVSFEPSAGLEDALREAFSGDDLDDRLAVYRDQPPREPVTVNGERIYLRSAGIEGPEARDAVRAFTPEGGRPEPLRVARLVARAANRWRTDS